MILLACRRRVAEQRLEVHPSVKTYSELGKQASKEPTMHTRMITAHFARTILTNHVLKRTTFHDSRHYNTPELHNIIRVLNWIMRVVESPE